uniref:Uncharacterized protein n=1 Tax=Myoviridae sp. cte5Z19 TaxID=2825145 RepID=A0A8S5NU24_9CAUD|nr:MAG TPA: hypothetical protein [Myoviridae sp. cte5Z19]
MASSIQTSVSFPRLKVIDLSFSRCFSSFTPRKMISHLPSHHDFLPTPYSVADYPVLPVFCLFLCSIISQLLRRFVLSSRFPLYP